MQERRAESEFHPNCAEHSGVKVRLAIILGLLISCMGGIITLIAMTASIYIGMNANIAETSRIVSVNTEKIDTLETRVTSLEQDSHVHQ
jgi:hypothetical protein